MLPDLKELDPETIALIEPELPPTAKDMMRIIGFEATWSLLQIAGGLELRVPVHDRWHFGNLFDDVAAAIGKLNTSRFMAEYGGQEIYIPSCCRLAKMLRNHRIVRDFDQLTQTASGRVAVAKIARRHLLSYRSVEKIINRESYKKNVHKTGHES